MLAGFDAAHARAMGLDPGRLDGYLLALLALAIVVAMKAVGVVLVIAMLIAPGALGFLLTTRFDRMLLIASAGAIGSSLAGVMLSFHIDSAPGPTIVVLQSVVVGLAILYRVRLGRRIADPA